MFVSDAHFRNSGGVVLFYTGNEADVELYVNHTGLMWEHAERLGALLVWAEHRYYGQTQPCGGKDLAYLTHEQALADYKANVATLRAEYKAEGVAVVALGGSYGGMLSAWFRMRYPGTVDGAIAASAPILAFPGVTPAYDTETYWGVVTGAASEKPGGAAAACAANVRAAWKPLFTAADDAGDEGKAALQRDFTLCAPPAPLGEQSAGERLAYFAMMAFDTMAMGNFPFESDYLTGGTGIMLPAYPVRAACEHLKDVGLPADTDQLLQALGQATSVFTNPGGSLPCVDLPEDLTYDGIWDYQYCTQLLPQETYFARDGARDMFWPSAYDPDTQAKHCAAKYGVTPNTTLIAREYGGLEGVKRATNIVFSNGLLDPWSSGGVLQNVSGADESVVAIQLPSGAHHSDLFFSNEKDAADVAEARLVELMHIRRWAAAGRSAGAVKGADAMGAAPRRAAAQARV